MEQDKHTDIDFKEHYIFNKKNSDNEQVDTIYSNILNCSWRDIFNNIENNENCFDEFNNVKPFYFVNGNKCYLCREIITSENRMITSCFFCAKSFHSSCYEILKSQYKQKIADENMESNNPDKTMNSKGIQSIGNYSVDSDSIQQICPEIFKEKANITQCLFCVLK